MLSKFFQTIGKRVIKGYKPQRLPNRNDNIIIAMSSGVDSSVSAALFAEQYPNARGIYIQSWGKSQSLTDPQFEPCYERDWKDVSRVAEHLGIPIEKVNFEKEYWLDVFEPMLETYNKGWTPNPDIGCNRFVKFGKLREYLDQQYGTNNYWLVTGHYARVLTPSYSEQPHLLRSLYTAKDQSYYLSQVDPNILGQLIFPTGHLTKAEVRELAAFAGLTATSRKPDSQGICFVNNSQSGKFKHFLEHYLPDSPGNIVSIEENGHKSVWGRHQGLWSYTIGQKIGISMPQGDPKYAGSWYVSDKLKDSNEIIIVRGRDNPALYQNSVIITDTFTLDPNFHRLTRAAIEQGELFIQYRSLQDPVSVKDCHFDKGEIVLKLDNAQRAMAPGQYCCLYLQDRVLGSGTISRVGT